jgi:hypothetical protein
MSETILPLGRLWRRYFSVVLTTTEGSRVSIADLRCTFDVRQFDNQSPNTADVYLYNLSENTARTLQQEFTRVSVWAGYETLFYPIFEGTVKQFRYGRSSPTDTFLNLRCADGDVAYNQATINVTLAAGCTAEDKVAAMLTVLENFQITRGEISGLPTERSPRAVVLSGNVRDLLRELCSAWGCSWSFQGMRLTILPLGTQPFGEQPIVLNSSTGMIGRPEQTLEGIRVRTLLNPRITVHSGVLIENRSIQLGQYDLSYLGEVQNTMLRDVRITEDGLYRVLAVDHFGDTKGTDWYSEIVCIASGDPVTIPQAQRGRQ